MSRIHIIHKNPEASMTLTIPVDVVCNTPFEVLKSNILTNSKTCKKWIKQSEKHDGTAILCGSAPSIKDYVEEIRIKQADGCKVFALNGAAVFLNSQGIIPDYQLMMDAKIANDTLIGKAKEYIFSSTVNPYVVGLLDNVMLFQLQVEDEELSKSVDKLAPDDYATVYSSVSIGLTAASVAFTMGYRAMDFYGYDSSHDEHKSHVIHQSINDENPCMEHEFNGKKYYVSIAMKLQADRFQELALALKNEGCDIAVHGYGLLPDMYNYTAISEQEKYSRMWTIPAYRMMSPAANIVETIKDNIPNHGYVYDFGCGTARAALSLTKDGYNVVCLDFAPNCRDPEAEHLPFVQFDLTGDSSILNKTKFGYCIDVMEHIPPELVDKAINNIMAHAETVFFQISTIPDKMGELIGQKLHLTVKNFQWWKQRIESLGYSVSSWTETDIDCNLVVTRKER